ncbi:MAG: hypothetical protein ACF8Q5_01660 [Phycisphaerales bacterium JB040]
MLRAILGVILGYVAMFVIVAVGLTIAFLVLGNDRAFQPGTYDITPLWGGVMMGVGVVAAIVGGVACALIARRGSKAPIGLAVFVLIMGVLSAVMAMGAEDPGPRAEDVQTFEAASRAQQPMWTLIANPVVGVVGVLIGARFTGRASAGTAAPDQPPAP